MHRPSHRTFKIDGKAVHDEALIDCILVNVMKISSYVIKYSQGRYKTLVLRYVIRSIKAVCFIHNQL